MGFFDRFRAAFTRATPASDRRPVVREKPLHEQFTRIGGNLTPADVSRIIAEADLGQPARLYDLFHESREKDGHLQSVCFTRETAIGLLPWQFLGPDESEQKRGDKKALELCKRTVAEFENWPTLLDTLTSAIVPGHATLEIKWRKTADGWLLPYRCDPISSRDFIFSRTDGKLRYARHVGDQVGVDLLADFPGRVVQIQRRIVGDVPAREGLIRIFTWAALFRNWTIKDWLALAEVGWKPWRIGTYQKGASQEDKDALVDLLELIGAKGIGIKADTTDVAIEWPKGTMPTGGQSNHRELFETVGREISKACLGQTTSVESSPNGDRAATETRDAIRADIRETDAVHAAACLRSQLFNYVVALNVGENARVPVPHAVTDEAVDQLNFASAVEKLAKIKLRMGSKWVRDQFGAPEPKEGEECIGDAEPEEDDSKQAQGDEKPEAA